ncbi:MAG TPA: DegT/DnrJ/EryC1/StrS family aminotransferase [Candidatus Omnitrophota bacterium]|mgnify:CR=1 FL=1|nr:DegT/DnrJ/EryC1/StrS family aminotransferase [Candidatus Omnitrophota bacterium]
MSQTIAKKVPAQRFGEQYKGFRTELLEAVDKVCASGQFILGEEVRLFEEEYAKWLGAAYAAGVGNGTDAIVLALLALGIGPGDEVIAPSHTYFATGNAIVKTGAKLVLADIDLETYNIDPARIEKRITKKTKAIVPVHLYGQPCRMDQIVPLAKKHNLFLVEDCAQAHGTKFEGRSVGTFGEFGCFSFFPTKNLGAYGDAGIVVTSDEKLLQEVRILRNQGMTKRYHHDKLGFNSRLDTLQAAILRVKLRKYMAGALETRRKRALAYTEMIARAGLGQVKVPFEDPRGHHTYHQYVIRVEKRDELLKHLGDAGVECYIYYPFPLHLTRALEFSGYRQGDFPNSEKAAAETFALPIYPELTDADQEYVVEKISEFYAR